MELLWSIHVTNSIMLISAFVLLLLVYIVFRYARPSPARNFLLGGFCALFVLQVGTFVALLPIDPATVNPETGIFPRSIYSGTATFGFAPWSVVFFTLFFRALSPAYRYGRYEMFLCLLGSVMSLLVLSGKTYLGGAIDPNGHSRVVFGPWFPVYTGVILVVLLTFIVQVWQSFRNAKEHIARQQVLFPGLSVVIGAGAIIGLEMVAPLAIGYRPVSTGMTELTIVAICLAFTYSIVRFRLSDTKVFLKDATVFIILALTVSLIVGGSLYLLGLRSIEAGLLIFDSLLIGLIVSMLIIPLHRGISLGMSKFVFRTHYNFQRDLYELTRALTYFPVTDYQYLASFLEKNLSRLFAAKEVRLGILNDRDGKLYIYSSNGLDDRYAWREFDLWRPFEEWLSSGEPIVDLEFKYSNPQLYAKFGGGLGALRAAALFPLMANQSLLGFLIVGENRARDFYSTTDIKFLETISNQVAIALENLRLSNETAQAQSYRKEIEETLQARLRLDAMTGVPNRLAIEERLNAQFDSFRHGGASCVLAIVDVDHFKKVNDTYGHVFGDRALKHIAGTIQENIRTTDFFGRFGGEEFVILFRDIKLEEGFRTCEKLRQIIQATPVKEDGNSMELSVSIGLTQFSSIDESAKETTERADRGLYIAKKRGRNQVILLDSSGEMIKKSA